MTNSDTFIPNISVCTSTLCHCITVSITNSYGHWSSMPICGRWENWIVCHLMYLYRLEVLDSIKWDVTVACKNRAKLTTTVGCMAAIRTERERSQVSHSVSEQLGQLYGDTKRSTTRGSDIHALSSSGLVTGSQSLTAVMSRIVLRREGTDCSFIWVERQRTERETSYSRPTSYTRIVVAIVGLRTGRSEFWGSIPGGCWEFFSSPPRREGLWGPPSLLSNGYQGLFPWE
jgi:hypothetical protein